MKRITVLFLCGFAVTSIYACSSSDTTATPSPGSDAGGSTSDGGATDSGAKTDSNVDLDSGIDAAIPAPCTDAELDAPGANYTGVDAGGQGVGGADISFPAAGQPAAQYTPRCVKIKVGQKVTFAGGFSSHPLEARGGTTPSPIPGFTNTEQDGGALTVTFTSAGTFGFRCGIHQTAMTGAVKVVP